MNNRIDRDVVSDIDREACTDSFVRPEGALASGRVIGGRYRIGPQLGRGGMGEVWQATDLKLRVEVALKAMHPALLADERHRELLRREVRAAREVISPNVCRVFDLVETEGGEMVSMEFVDGDTLLRVLGQRGPLDLGEAQAIASQFLAGVEAIHQAGLVHRDLKPENIMLTRSGRVVVMDFGLAKQVAPGVAATVAGTPAYMAPEQVRGEALDARTDVYAAGIVLAEMVNPSGVADPDSRQSVWSGIRLEPVRVPESPWAPVLRRAVASEPDDRFPSALALTRALETITLRVDGAEDRTPYPGLAAFTEADAEFFFGREAEVEALWSRLDRPRLLAVVGPSGAGKSSFLRAGLVASRPPDWGCVVVAPGTAPAPALREALVPELAHDVDAMRRLVRGDEADALVAAVAGWRRRHHQALLVVDQFEELFTLNPEPVQEEFAQLLARLALEADVHVLIALRDDFLLHCHRFEALTPIFSELTPLGPPLGMALRRALVQPAARCGYRIEDESLLTELLEEVEGERGALPLVAFAMARLWELRERESGLLTRSAYAAIGGVGGALARHAESVLEGLGEERRELVRELFRNLVTAQGTRAVREVADLLSVFPEELRTAAREVLTALVDARLLTVYEVEVEGGEPHRRVEIIHESLLRSWPRLVRWQTQDADALQYRDELRQAAALWLEHGRPEDRLWTGPSYRELALWRERYQGGLSTAEEEFVAASRRVAWRRRRRRRVVVALGMAVLIATSLTLARFWRSAEQARAAAVSHARRADASRLYTLGQLAPDRSSALAYAIASLELEDRRDVRLFALRTLWSGPTLLAVPDSAGAHGVAFAADGTALAVGYEGRVEVLAADGSRAATIDALGGQTHTLHFSPDGRRLLTSSRGEPWVRLWALPSGELLRRFEAGEAIAVRAAVSPGWERLLTGRYLDQSHNVEWRSWELAGSAVRDLGRTHSEIRAASHAGAELVALSRGPRLAVHGLPVDDAPPVAVRTLERTPLSADFSPDGRRLAVVDAEGEIHLWSFSEPDAPLRRVGRAGELPPATPPWFDPSGRRLAVASFVMKPMIWDLDGPAGADPIILDEELRSEAIAAHPSAPWLATAEHTGVYLWASTFPYPAVLRGHRGRIYGLDFSPDGRQLVSAGEDGTLRLWPLAGDAEPRTLLRRTPEVLYESHWSEDGSTIACGAQSGRVLLASVDGGDTTALGQLPDAVWTTAIDPGGRLVAASGWGQTEASRGIWLWELESGRQRVLDDGDGHQTQRLAFTADGHLLSVSGGVLRRWDVTTGASTELLDGVNNAALSRDGRRAAVLTVAGGVEVVDLDGGRRTPLPSATIRGPFHVAISGDGELVVVADWSGAVVVVAVETGETHLLLGHRGVVWRVAISPDGRRIASAGWDDGTIRVWKAPDLGRRPPQDLPSDRFVAGLKTFTTRRVVADDDADEGYRVVDADFPGWQTLPGWR